MHVCVVKGGGEGGSALGADRPCASPRTPCPQQCPCCALMPSAWLAAPHSRPPSRGCWATATLLLPPRRLLGRPRTRQRLCWWPAWTLCCRQAAPRREAAPEGCELNSPPPFPPDYASKCTSQDRLSTQIMLSPPPLSPRLHRAQLPPQDPGTCHIPCVFPTLPSLDPQRQPVAPSARGRNAFSLPAHPPRFKLELDRVARVVKKCGWVGGRVGGRVCGRVSRLGSKAASWGRDRSEGDRQGQRWRAGTAR